MENFVNLRILVLIDENDKNGVCRLLFKCSAYFKIMSFAIFPKEVSDTLRAVTSKSPRATVEPVTRLENLSKLRPSADVSRTHGLNEILVNLVYLHFDVEFCCPVSVTL